MIFSTYSYKNFDIYGFSPKLFINGHSKEGTLFGLITTILTILIMLTIISYYFSKLFFYKDLTSIDSTRVVNLNESVFLNKNSSFFAFALEDPNNYEYYIDETIYYPKISYRIGKKGEDGNFIYKSNILNYSKCDSKYFHKDYKNLISNNTLSKMYCIPNLNLELKGSFSDDYYSFITIRLYPCKNSTNSKKCQPQENINYYLNGTIFSLSYQNFNIDPKDYKYPIKSKLGDFYTTVSTHYYKELYIHFKKFILKTDNGLIFENIKEENFSVFDYSMDMMSFKLINEYFMQLNIRMSSNVAECTRTYPKIQIFLSYIGGFIAFIESFFSNINYILIHSNIFEKIINKIFFISNKPIHNKRKLMNFFSYVNINNNNINDNNKNKKSNKNFSDNLINIKNNSINDSLNKSLSFLINDDKKNYNNKNKMMQSEINIKVKNSLNFNNYLNSKEIQKKNINNQIRNSKTIEHESDKYYLKKLKGYKLLNLSYCNILFSRFLTKNENIKLFLKGINIIKQKLDIISIIKDSFQLQLLTNLSFNQEHIILLENYIKNDLNSCKLEINKNNLNESEKINEQILKSFDKIVNRKIINKYNNEQSKNIDKYFIDLILKQNE